MTAGCNDLPPFLGDSSIPSRGDQLSTRKPDGLIGYPRNHKFMTTLEDDWKIGVFLDLLFSFRLPTSEYVFSLRHIYITYPPISRFSRS